MGLSDRQAADPGFPIQYDTCIWLKPFTDHDSSGVASERITSTNGSVVIG